MGRLTAFILLLTGVATGVLAATAHQPLFLALAELSAATFMLLCSIKLLLSVQPQMQWARRRARRS